MGPNRQSGQSEADFINTKFTSGIYEGRTYSDLYANGIGHTSDTATLSRLFGADGADAFQYLNDAQTNSPQNSQDLQLYQKAMLDHMTAMRQSPGRQGTVLTGDPLTPTPNFNPTSIL